MEICKVSDFGSFEERSYRPNVQYSFEVGDQTYYGNSYILGERTWGRSAVEKMVSEMESRRDDFSVSYSPADPSMNVVIPGINSVHVVRALTGIGIVGATVLE